MLKDLHWHADKADIIGFKIPFFQQSLIMLNKLAMVY